MKLWQSRALGIVDVGGGAIGILASFTALYSNFGIAAVIVIPPFILLYCFAVFTGVLTLERSETAIRANWWLWLIQIPIFTSPAFSYIFSCGALLATSIQLSPVNYKFNWMVGSQFKLTINQNDPLMIGINIFAILVFVWVGRLKTRPAPHSSFQPTPLRGTA